MSKKTQEQSVVERLLEKHEGKNNATISALKIAQKRREEKEAEALAHRLEANLSVMEHNIATAVEALREVRRKEKQISKIIEDLNAAEESFLADLDALIYNGKIFSMETRSKGFSLRAM